MHRTGIFRCPSSLLSAAFDRVLNRTSSSNGYQVIESLVIVADDDKQSCFLISYFLKLHLIIIKQVGNLGNIKICQPDADADQNGFCRLTRNELSRTFSDKTNY